MPTDLNQRAKAIVDFATSKKVENHAHAVSLHFMHYNIARKHQTLKGATPAMAAGIERHPWSLMQIAELLD